MYSFSAVDAARANRLLEVERRQNAYDLGKVKSHASMARSMMDPVWEQIGPTALALVNTLLIEINRRQAKLGIAITTGIKVGLTARSMISSIKNKRQAKREEKRWKKVARRAEGLVAYWEESSKTAITVLTSAGVTELVPMTKNQEEALLATLRTGKGIPWHAPPSPPKTRSTISPWHGRYGKKAWVLAYIAGTAYMMNELSPRLSKLLAEPVEVVPTTTVQVSEQVRSASPADGVMQNVLERNAQVAHEVAREGAEVAPVMTEAPTPGAVIESLQTVPGEPVRRRPRWGWLLNALDRVSPRSVLRGE